MWRSERPEQTTTAGFTLVEALAALAVLMVGLAAIGALSNASVRSSVYAERRLAQIAAARSILAGLPGRNDLPFGRLTGVLDGFKWRADVTAVATTDSRRSSEWTPQGVVLLMRSPSGAVMEVDTIRLRRAPPR